MDKENALNCQEISIIIKECGSHGVKLFKMGELEIHFHGREEPTPQVSEPNPIVQDNATKDPIDDAKFMDYDSVQRELKAEELAIMQIADPERYEELLANPELLQEFSHEVEELEGA